MVWRWKHFTQKEMSCKCCEAFILDEDFMDKLERLRVDFGKPMKINSAYRCSKHNNAVSKTGLTGVHTTGKAADVKVFGKDAYDLLHLALLHGFTGIGISQAGEKGSRFIHLDTLKDATIRPTVWSYQK